MSVCEINLFVMNSLLVESGKNNLFSCLQFCFKLLELYSLFNLGRFLEGTAIFQPPKHSQLRHRAQSAV